MELHLVQLWPPLASHEEALASGVPCNAYADLGTVGVVMGGGTPYARISAANDYNLAGSPWQLETLPPEPEESSMQNIKYITCAEVRHSDNYDSKALSWSQDRNSVNPPQRTGDRILPLPLDPIQ